MIRAIPVRRSKKTLKFTSVFRKDTSQKPQSPEAWNDHHNKAITTAGRGGKGHGSSSQLHAWNRKGRW